MDAYAQQSYNAFGYQQPYQQPQQQQQQSHQHQQHQQTQQQLPQQNQQYQSQPEAGGSSNFYTPVGLNGYYGYANGSSNGYANGNGTNNGQLHAGQQQQQQQHYQPQFPDQLHQMQAQQQHYTIQPQAIHGNGNGQLNDHSGYQPYDPFQLGVLTGAGMHFNPIQQQQQYQHYYAPIQQTTLDINNIHRPSLQPTISPADSQPGSNASSHRNLHVITPDRVATHSPDKIDDRVSPQPGAVSGPARTGRQKEGPVKAACLSCRQKKAKCDGVQPVCTQVRRR